MKNLRVSPHLSSQQLFQMRTRVAMLFLILTLSVAPLRAQGDEGSGQEFITSIIYGTAAGTLVGAATLAFTDDPGGNLGNIARGASLGLYAGILLGFYVSSGRGERSENESHDGDEIPKDTTVTPQDSPSSNRYPGPDSSRGLTPALHKQEPLYGFSIFPFAEKNRVGVGANLIRLHF